MIDYPDDTPQRGRGGWWRNADGKALVAHPKGHKRKLAYDGASDLWKLDGPYNGHPIYGERGTHLHSICDRADAGEPLDDDFIAIGENLGITRELQAYIYARWQVFLKDHGLTVVGVEIPVVNDELKVATNIDRLLRTPTGEVVVADIKSSTSVDKPGYLVQLAATVGCVPYDQDNDERGAW